MRSEYLAQPIDKSSESDLETVVRHMAETADAGQLHELAEQIRAKRASATNVIDLEEIRLQASEQALEQERDEIAVAIERLSRGYSKIPNQVFMNAELSMAAKFIYACLLVHMETRGFSLVAQRTLAQYSKLGERQTRTYLKELEAAGWLTIKQSGPNKANRYNLHVLPPLFKKGQTTPVDRQYTAAEKPLTGNETLLTGNTLPTQIS
jgi:hypothetical protein